MAHLRDRHLIAQLRKSSRFWPVVGVLGLRQAGKSTLLSSLLRLPNHVTLDDQDALEDARLSAKNFLAKLRTPVAIDEAQKAPALFDAIKFRRSQRYTSAHTSAAMRPQRPSRRYEKNCVGSAYVHQPPPYTSRRPSAPSCRRATA